MNAAAAAQWCISLSLIPMIRIQGRDVYKPKCPRTVQVKQSVIVDHYEIPADDEIHP